MRLTEITRTLCKQFGVIENVLPMTDTVVTTQVLADNRVIHYQDYWVKSQGKIPIQAVQYFYQDYPVAPEEVLAAIDESDAVVIGPSNPITSISPILICDGLCEALNDKFVIAISPFIGNAPVSGPAAALMQAKGFEPNSKGTLACYDNVVDLFIQDIRDTVEVEDAIRLDTLMTDEQKSINLAREILDFVKTG
jgi:LPPG:FO 2-phospho-L-lactate transferase